MKTKLKIKDKNFYLYLNNREKYLNNLLNKNKNKFKYLNKNEFKFLNSFLFNTKILMNFFIIIFIFSIIFIISYTSYNWFIYKSNNHYNIEIKNEILLKYNVNYLLLLGELQSYNIWNKELNKDSKYKELVKNKIYNINSELNSYKNEYKITPNNELINYIKLLELNNEEKIYLSYAFNKLNLSNNVYVLILYQRENILYHYDDYYLKKLKIELPY